MQGIRVPISGRANVRGILSRAFIDFLSLPVLLFFGSKFSIYRTFLIVVLGQTVRTSPSALIMPSTLASSLRLEVMPDKRPPRVLVQCSDYQCQRPDAMKP